MKWQNNSDSSRARVTRWAFGHLGRRSLFAILGAAVFSALLLFGCLAPTLPLPPPSAPLITSPNDAGIIQIRGRVQTRASVFIRNTRTSKGVYQQTGDSGRYDLEMKAEIGDVLSLWQRVGTHESEAIEVTVPETEMKNSVPPPAGGGAGGASP